MPKTYLKRTKKLPTANSGCVTFTVSFDLSVLMLSEQPQICKTHSLLRQSMVMSFVTSRNAFSWKGFWFKGAIFALITKLLRINKRMKMLKPKIYFRLSSCCILLFQASYIRIDGSVPSAERIKLVHRFQNDPDTRVAILSIQAAGQVNNQTTQPYEHCTAVSKSPHNFVTVPCSIHISCNTLCSSVCFMQAWYTSTL